jgi:hypothetical protein
MRDKITMKVNTTTGELNMPKQVKSNGGAGGGSLGGGSGINPAIKSAGPSSKGNTGPGNPGNNPSGVNIMHGFGTSEGVNKSWDTRGRGVKQLLHKAGFSKDNGGYDHTYPAKPTEKGFSQDLPHNNRYYIDHSGKDISWNHSQADSKFNLHETAKGKGYDSLERHIQKTYSVKAARNCHACTVAKSMGVLEEPDDSDEGVPSPSDAGSRTEASDQRKYLFPKEQIKAPGVSRWTGGNNSHSPGSGVGPRVARSTGGSRSEMSRLQDTVEVDAGSKVVSKIYTKAPPGHEKQVLELKKKFGEDSSTPFKIAWDDYGKEMEAKGK